MEFTNMENLSLSEYQNQAMRTAIYPLPDGEGFPVYPILGLTGEAGEVAEKVKKVLRDKDGIASKDDLREIAKELGDVLWYLTAIAGHTGYSLEEIAQINLDKLNDRKDRGALGGSGDNR